MTTYKHNISMAFQTPAGKLHTQESDLHITANIEPIEALALYVMHIVEMSGETSAAKRAALKGSEPAAVGYAFIKDGAIQEPEFILVGDEALIWAVEEGFDLAKKAMPNVEALIEAKQNAA